MLREYQKLAIEQIRDEFKKGNKKVLLVMPTGSGKTVCFSEIIKSAGEKGKRTLVMVRGKKLVDQASHRLIRERVEHGVLMSGHWNYRPHLPHQVASIDTLIARKLRPRADIVVVDEAHMACSNGYKNVLLSYQNSFIVAVTATPWLDTSLRHIADAVVKPITMIRLTELGFLKPFRYFAPSEPDLTDVHVSKSTHDYVTNELEGAMTAGGLTGKVVEHWKKLANGRPTICFAVNIKHSKILRDQFLASGVPADHCDSDSSDSERDEIIRRLENGTTKVVCNVGILSTGVDIPCVSAIIMARPTKSRNLFVQQAGRGTRPFPGKDNCLLLDHAGNLHRHGLPTDEDDVDLDGRKAKSITMESKTCKECFAVFRGAVCPECGVVPPALETPPPEESEEELVELKDIDPILRELKKLKKEADKQGYRAAWCYHKLVEKYEFEKCRKFLPAWFIKCHENPFSASPYRGFGK